MTSQDFANLTDGDGQIYLDLRYFPLFINHWRGATTTRMIDEYYEIRNPLAEKARAEGTKLISIADLGAMKAPPATVRKYLADSATKYDQMEGFYGYVVVVPNALIRGMVTAITWVTGDKQAKTVYASSMADGIRKALGWLNELNLPSPTINPDTYEAPE